MNDIEPAGHCKGISDLKADQMPDAETVPGAIGSRENINPVLPWRGGIRQRGPRVIGPPGGNC